MEKIYNPGSVEQHIYECWEQKGYFKPRNNKNKEYFCIMIPPPNITGNLHIGHAFQQTIIDTIIRYKRMQGKNTLWQIGTDHAGIATQIAVERKIAYEEGKTRYDYGREAFIERVWQWKVKSRNTIVYQMRRLGNSIDWERERFTMDKGFSNAVIEAFIRLYKEGLIYRSKKLVNWDPKLQTAISNLEVKNRESKGFIWYIRYPLADGVKTIDNKNYLVVATTRPETLLGDTGVAINLKDQRYKNLIGKFIVLPLINRRIPIIGDEYANIEKGAGCVKITPAHDFNDYKIGCRHSLPMINILTLDGRIRKRAQVFNSKGQKSNIYSDIIPTELQGLEILNAREAIITAIDSLNLLEGNRPHNLNLPYSDRSDVVIEPMLTDQWFVRTSMLSKLAIEAVEKEDIQFIPKRYKNMYFSWMRNIQDWCISRQLWWGHRIPAWYDKQGNIYVGHDKEEVYRENNLSTEVILHQDDDVLDTWFSSALWTFSTLGWPENTRYLSQFHPTDVIISGFDIIFFWIARMIMMTMHLIKDDNGRPQVPFKFVYITGLIRDYEGQKMSKSKDNVIDPIDIIDGISLQDLVSKRTDNLKQPKLIDEIRKRTMQHFPSGIKSYGADTLRFSLITLPSTGRCINWNMKRLEGYRNFCNKLWHAGRFVLIHTKNQNCGFNNDEKMLSSADRWILSKFNLTIKNYRNELDGFRFDIAANILYEFIWNQFCAWYLELSKLIINSGNELEIRGTRNTLVIVLEAILRLAHPIIPFITETIWQYLKGIAGINSDTIMLQSFPEYDASQIDKNALDDIEWLKKIIVAIRNFRFERKLNYNKPFKLILQNCNSTIIRRVNENRNSLKAMAYLEDIDIQPIEKDKNLMFITKVVDGTELIIPITGLINKDNELNRLRKEIEKVEIKINYINNKLINEKFISSAPEAILIKERERLTHLTEIKRTLIKQQDIINMM